MLEPRPRSPNVVGVVSVASSFIASQQLFVWSFVPNIVPLQTGLFLALLIVPASRKVRLEWKPGADAEIFLEDESSSPLVEAGIVEGLDNNISDGSSNPETKMPREASKKTLGWTWKCPIAMTQFPMTLTTRLNSNWLKSGESRYDFVFPFCCCTHGRSNV